MTSKRNPLQLISGLVLAVGGIIVVLFGLRGTDLATTELAASDLTRSLVVIFAGGVMFAFGAMLLLVALVRPLFAKRPSDHAADRLPHGR